MTSVFTIDGVNYNVKVMSIKRSAAVLDGENTQRMSDGDMFRDVIGTFYNYTVTVEAKNLTYAQYDLLYETLTAPVDFHNIVLPYGQSTISFQAYCTGAEDMLMGIEGNLKKWGVLSFTFIAKQPARVP